MKKMIRVISLLVVLSVFLGVMSIGVGALNISTDEESVMYTKEQNEIFAKVEELGLLKAKLLADMDRAGVDDTSLKAYSDLFSDTLKEIETLRTELIEMGAKPSKEVLSSIKMERPMKVNGVLIDDFSDFEYTFGDVFDLWGISQTVNASYGTYYTYEIMIQDYAGKKILASSVSQNGSKGFDLYNTGANLSDVVYGALSSIVIEKLAKTIGQSAPIINTIYSGTQILETVLSANSNIQPGQAVTTEGTSHEHRIFVDLAPTVRFIFVRDSSNAAWQHTFTTNTVSVLEKQRWYHVFPIGNAQFESSSGEKDFNTTLFPDKYAYRLTNAITAYRNNKALYYDNVTEYTVNVKKGGTTKKAFSVDVTCPMDEFDLIRYGLQ